jgi:hypothetical protein
MAGEWIKMEHTLPEKPEVMRMARALGVDADLIVGKLARLWGWIDGVSVDGSVDGVVAADVDRICRCDGFAAACVLVGWLLVDDAAERVTLPNFDNHNGETAKKRALKNRRQAKWRANVDDSVDVAASTSASTREEKRREEKDQKLSSPAGDCPHAEILEAYHELLPANPRMKVWAGKRMDSLRSRWREDAKRQSLDYWRRFFTHVAASPFLTGQVSGTNGRPFLPGLDWLVLPENFAKVIEGRYHERK